MSKNHSMIFDADSIRAFMAGAKTQTRRVVKPQPGPDSIVAVNSAYLCVTRPGADAAVTIRCPHPPDSILYAKEAWWITGPMVGSCLMYAATDAKLPTLKRWRSPLFMPAWAARLWFRVVDVRCERVHEIGRDGRKACDVLAEGITREQIEHQAKWFHPDDAPAVAFAARWNSINAKRYPWASNPWVFAYTLERIEKP